MIKTNINKTKQLFLILIFIIFNTFAYSKDTVYSVYILKDWKPYYSLDKNGKPIGYTIDLFEALAKDAGIKYQYKLFDNWTQMTPYRKSQEYIVPNTGIVKSRAEYTKFSNPTDTFQIKYFKRDISYNINSKDDLKNRKVAVVKDNVCERLVKENSLEKIIYNDYLAALSDLLSGEIDAMCYPKPLLDDALKNLHLSNKVVSFGKPLKEVKRGLGFSHNNAHLIPKFNKSLQKLKENRTYEKIYKKWFVEEDSIKLSYEELVLLSAAAVIAVVILFFMVYYLTRRKKWLLTQNELEKEVKEKTARFELAIKASKAGIWEWNFKNNTLIWDQKMYEIYGIKKTSDDHPYSVWSNALDKNELPKVERNLNNAVETHSDYNISFWITTQKGKRKYIQALGINEYDENDKPIRMVGTNIDITDQKLKDEELKKEENYRKKNEERLEKIVELSKKASKLTIRELYDAALDIAVEITNSKVGYLHTFNEELNEISLVTWNKEALKHCTAAYDDHYPLKNAGIWADSVRLKKVVVHNDYETEPLKKGLPKGHFKVIRDMSAPVLEGDTVTMIIGVGNKESFYDKMDEELLQATVNDVEKLIFRKRAEDKVLEKKEEFETIFKSVRDGIAITNLDTKFISCNDAFSEISGFSKEELLTKSCEELTIEEDRQTNKEAIQYAIEHGHNENIEKRCKTKNGKIFSASFSITRLPDKNSLLITIKDMTILKQLEEQSKLASMGEMIGNIAHQWRQPLSVITTSASGLDLKADFGEEVTKEDIKKFSHIITTQANYLSKTIDDFKNFIKGDTDYLLISVKEALENSLYRFKLKLTINNT
ncbi:MAG: transporter substrate-binding domain-containing protein [Campylobacterota bacterium]|nr:transporter substrate-binding domain-containing protein [Campylobacterota bacterium]